MKLPIVILVIIILLVGFVFYGVVRDEIEEAGLSSIQTFDIKDIKLKDVDNLSVPTIYTHRSSTYVDSSLDLVKASSRIKTNSEYLSFFYYLDQILVHEEYLIEEEALLEIGQIQEEILLILPKETIKTNLDIHELTFFLYDDNQQMIHIIPEQTGLYQVSIEGIKLTFEFTKTKDQ